MLQSYKQQQELSGSYVSRKSSQSKHLSHKLNDHSTESFIENTTQSRRYKQLINNKIEKVAPKVHEFQSELRQIRQELGE